LAAKWRTNVAIQNRIYIKDKNDDTRTEASVALISHGANGYGAYNAAGKQVNYSNLQTTDKDYLNIPRSGRGVNIYTDLVSDRDVLGEGWIGGFDDIVRYYNIFELRTVSGR